MRCACQPNTVAITACYCPRDPRPTVFSALTRHNPREPSGEWSVYDLAEWCERSIPATVAALDDLRESEPRLGCRYVGGISKYLYSLVGY